MHDLTALLQDVRGGELKGNDCKLIFAKSELKIACSIVDAFHMLLHYMMIGHLILLFFFILSFFTSNNVPHVEVARFAPGYNLLLLYFL